MTRLPPEILREIRALQHEGTAALQKHYEAVFGRPTVCRKDDVLRRAIAYRLQENFYGGLSAEHKEALENAIADEPRLSAPAAMSKPPIGGTRFVREWKGVRHEVTMCSDGNYEYGGRIFRSLSAVAREITGTRWNGKVFFGVRK